MPTCRPLAPLCLSSFSLAHALFLSCLLHMASPISRATSFSLAHPFFRVISAHGFLHLSHALPLPYLCTRPFLFLSLLYSPPEKVRYCKALKFYCAFFSSRIFLDDCSWPKIIFGAKNWGQKGLRCEKRAQKQSKRAKMSEF